MLPIVCKVVAIPRMHHTPKAYGWAGAHSSCSNLTAQANPYGDLNPPSKRGEGMVYFWHFSNASLTNATAFVKLYSF
jgi:hypothetical protein